MIVQNLRYIVLISRLIETDALILALNNPQYDKRLNLRVQYMKSTSSEHLVYINCSECQNKNRKNNLCTQHVLSLYFPCTELVIQ